MWGSKSDSSHFVQNLNAGLIQVSGVLVVETAYHLADVTSGAVGRIDLDT